MAGSDLNLAFTSNTSGTQELFGGPTRLKAFIITPTANSGTVDFADGGTNKFTVSTSASAASGPVNIGSEEMVTINELVNKVAKVSGKAVSKRHKLDAPLGVRGRNSNNDLIREAIGWDYQLTLEEGLSKTYAWINEQVKKENFVVRT